MTTRFNTFGSTSGLATENTQRLIKDVLSGPLEVNVVTLPGGGTSNNITAVASEILPDAKLPVSIDRATISVPTTVSGLVQTNNTQINGNTISTGAGNSDSGTQRVSIVNDQNNIPVVVQNLAVPASLNLIDGAAVSTSNGISGLGTQRVVLANNQDTSNWQNVPTNLKALNGNTISLGSGITDAGTMRVTLPTDLNHDGWKKLQVQDTVFKPLGAFHVGFDLTTATTDTFWRQITPITKRFLDPITGAFSTDLWLPSSDSSFYIQSSSANDTLAGIGLRSVRIVYYNRIGQSLFSDINLNGTTPVLGNLSPNFFRLATVLPLSVGSANFNQGNIQITSSNVGPFLYYPGGIPSGRNLWQSSYFYINYNTGAGYTGGKIYSRTILDYINYLWHNGGGSDELIAIFLRDENINVWRIVNVQYNNNDIFYSPKLNNIQFNTETDYVEIMITFLKTGAGTTSITGALGYHNE